MDSFECVHRSTPSDSSHILRLQPEELTKVGGSADTPLHTTPTTTPSDISHTLRLQPEELTTTGGNANPPPTTQYPMNRSVCRRHGCQRKAGSARISMGLSAESIIGGPER
ncbi:hypothetical protein ACVWY6_002241 [Williamsia sp. R60]